MSNYIAFLLSHGIRFTEIYECAKLLQSILILSVSVYNDKNNSSDCLRLKQTIQINDDTVIGNKINDGVYFTTD